MQLALGVSLLLHAVLLTLRWVDPAAFNRTFQESALEVVLVNAKTSERSPTAQALAQFALAGGGEAESGRATSPLPPAALTEVGDALQDSRQRVDTLMQQQTQLLTQMRDELARLPLPQPNLRGSVAPNPEELERRRQLVQLLAEIERRVNSENARPKRRYISPSTREVVYALYYDALRRKIEQQGTQNFPQVNERKLYGDLTMILTINHDGQVLATEVVQGSGQSILDRQAQAIARRASPFGHFNHDMRRQADQIVVVARFKFTREATLETQLAE